MGTLRKVEREVLRRKHGNKSLWKAYRVNRTIHDRNYVVHKKALTRKGEWMLNGIVVVIVLMMLLLARG